MMPSLRLGSRGKLVRELQTLLAVEPDGILGPVTLAAARSRLGRKVDVLDLADLRACGVDVRLCIDLSGHNEGGTKKLVDFARVKVAGVRTCWLKLTEGTSYVNREALRQASAAEVYGLDWGGYHFADPSLDRTSYDVVALEADARAEAEHYLRQRAAAVEAACARPSAPDILDLERGVSARIRGKLLALTGWTSARRHEATALWALAWLTVVEQATGRKPWIYLPLWAFDAYFRKAPPALLSALRSYRNMVASYNAGAEPARIPPGWEDWGAWQYTGHGRIDGVDGDVDLSVALGRDLKGP